VGLGLGPGLAEGEALRAGRIALDDRDMSNMDVASAPKLENSSLFLTASGLGGDSSNDVECSAASIMLHTPSEDSSLGSGSVDRVTFAQARDSAMLRYKEKKKSRRCLNIVLFSPMYSTLHYSAVLFGVQCRVFYD